MKIKLTFGIMALAFAALPTVASAQSASIQRVIPITFTGIVANDVGSSIRIRQPDGTFTAFTGPVPDYPYVKGDAVSISFNANVPTRDYYTSGAYSGQIAADGIYRVAISGRATQGSSSTIGLGDTVDVSGPIQQGSNFGQAPGMSGLTIVYNSNTDNYSIEFPNNRWNAGPFDGPSFTYNSATGNVGTSPTTCIKSQGCTDLGDAGIGLSGNANQISTGNIRIYDLANATLGLFNIDFNGSWNLPIFGASGTGDPTDVPAPGSMLLFVGGVALLMRRQRKARLP
jgi:hypothetical protein